MERKANPRPRGRYLWTAEKYREIVAGNRSEGIEGLRTIAHGFDSSDGYDLRHVDKWSAYQKRKVREYFHRIELLTAQPKRLVRPKDPKNLRKLQESFHGGIPSENLKVAYIPDTEPKTTLPGAKRRPPKLRMLKEGISIERPEYERVFIPFNQKSLVKDPRREVKRVSDKMGTVSLYFVQVGEHQSLTGKSFGLITEQILLWMQQYDGKRALPHTSGNRGDNPKHHHWKYWLNGLIGYKLPRGVNIRKLAKVILKGRREAQEQSRERRNYMRRKNVKGRRS